MEEKDYPNYFIAGDRASLEAQKKYIIFTRIIAILTILYASLTIYSPEDFEYKRYLYISCMVLFALIIGISIFMNYKKYGDTWYRGRALAESCKTLTWRFMMKSELFEGNDGFANKTFCDNISEIKNQFKDHLDLDTKYIDKKIITDKMKYIRNKSLSKRKEFYLDNRIKNQKEWYSKKAKQNEKSNDCYFYFIIIIQSIGFLSIIPLIINPKINLNIVGLCTTISASIFSWMQLKKYRENKDAYKTALSELVMIEEKINNINKEKDFVKFVLDSENAMSREHTLWLAQRRV